MKRIVIFLTLMMSCSLCIAEESLYSRERLSKEPWAKVLEEDQEVAKSVHLLWDILQKREQELERVSKQLFDLLDDNAIQHQDYVGAESTAILSRYHALDARFSFEISRQIDLIDEMIQPKEKPSLDQAFTEMLNTLGCESYYNFQEEIFTKLDQQEKGFNESVAAVGQAESLPMLQASLRKSLNLFASMQSEPSKVFLPLKGFKKELSDTTYKSIDRLLIKREEIGSDARTRIQNILEDVGAKNEEIQYFLERFDNPGGQGARLKGMMKFS